MNNELLRMGLLLFQLSVSLLMLIFFLMLLLRVGCASVH